MMGRNLRITGHIFMTPLYRNLCGYELCWVGKRGWAVFSIYPDPFVNERLVEYAKSPRVSRNGKFIIPVSWRACFSLTSFYGNEPVDRPNAALNICMGFSRHHIHVQLCIHLNPRKVLYNEEPLSIFTSAFQRSFSYKESRDQLWIGLYKGHLPLWTVWEKPLPTSSSSLPAPEPAPLLIVLFFFLLSAAISLKAITGWQTLWLWRRFLSNLIFTRQLAVCRHAQPAE